MTVNGGSLLSVKATASPRTAKVGQTVTLDRRGVQSGRPARRSPTCGTSATARARATGQDRSRTATRVSGDYSPRVEVEGSGGTNARCSGACGGPGRDRRARHRLASAGPTRRRAPRWAARPAGGGSGSGGTGGGTGTGDGSGLSGGAAGSNGLSRSAKAPAAARRAPRVARAVLHRPDVRRGQDDHPRACCSQGTGKAARRRPSAEQGRRHAEARARGPRERPRGRRRSPPALLLALGDVSMGALRERRRVRLRLA